MDVMEQCYNDSRSYLISRYPTTIFEVDQTSVMTPWNVLCYHKFYQQFHTEWNSSTAILLDIGGGPCIYPHISAAPYVAEIYHTDYVKSCRDEVLMWKNNDPNAYDWSAYFKQVVNTLEGQSDPKVVDERKERLRNVLKDVLPCDVKADIIVPAISVNVNIITCNFCLECTVGSLENFVVALGKIHDMLLPQGFLVMCLSLGCSWYMLNETKYLTGFALSVESSKASLEKAGFVVRFIECKEKPVAGRNINNDTTGQAFVVAQRS